MDTKLQNAVEQGIKFLSKNQEKDGSFWCLVSTRFDDYKNASLVPAIVPSNIVLSSLIRINTPEAKKIKKKTAEFLLSQRNEYWSFNYWFKGSKEEKIEPYPDDLDDTFCALSALYEYDNTIFNGDVMGKIITMLTSAEDSEGGPYNMWLVPKGKKGWQDIDLVVNSNIAYFLHLNGIHLPKLEQYFDKSIMEEDYEFPYNTIYPGIYFLARSYSGGHSGKMIDLLLWKKEKDGKWENPLRTALSVISLLNLSKNSLKREADDSIRYLLKTQNKDGSWDAYSFFYQMKLPKKTLFAGSASITTALCLEAINRYQSVKNGIAAKSTEENNLHFEIVSKFKERFSHLHEIKEGVNAILPKILKIDRQTPILLLPDNFASSLGKTLPKDFSVLLGLMNLHGWVAYTIYDDFLDGEGEPMLLPIANISLKELLSIIESIAVPDFKILSRKILDGIDEANAWEAKYSRTGAKIPDYEDHSVLASKSLGHALGPILVLMHLGYKKDSKEVKGIIQFFRHFLIARQLNDDAHDWHFDLKRGYLNSVSVMLAKDSRGLKESSRLEQIFWQKTMLQVSKTILSHISMAKGVLEGISAIKDKTILLSLLVPIENSIKEALAKRKETKDFLNSYKR